jgi:putative phosphoesterase
MMSFSGFARSFAHGRAEVTENYFELAVYKPEHQISLILVRNFHSIGLLGLVSDTHGLLRDSVKIALSGVGLIIHAGDIGRRGVLEELESIAPVVAVRGNVDSGFPDLSLTEMVSVNNQLIYILHDLATLDLVPEKAGISMVVSGHSHKARIERKNGVLYVNPGSIGPRRFRLPVTYATVAYGGNEPVVESVELA